jgi:hypothetical protein
MALKMEFNEVKITLTDTCRHAQLVRVSEIKMVENGRNWQSIWSFCVACIKATLAI